MTQSNSDTGAMAVGSGTSAAAKAAGRESFGAIELATCLSNYDLGVVASIKDFPRGSRKSPKLLIESETGSYLFKRRAPGRDGAIKVAFTHAIQLELSAKQYPLPHLIGTRRDNNSMLQWNGAIYELFEYIPGQGYPNTLDATFDSGRVLALYHKLLEHFTSDYIPPTGSYHNANMIDQGLTSLRQRFAGTSVETACASLQDAYHEGVLFVENAGLSDWPQQVVHGDWHPGNMLFAGGRVVAVIDYDSARLLPRVIDIANGCLQFSIIGGEEDVTRWPSYADESRFKRFLRGYDQVVLLSDAEISVIPRLMVEALIAEAVYPIAATGKFGRFDGGPFLEMVARKVEWLRQKTPTLIELVSAS